VRDQVGGEFARTRDNDGWVEERLVFAAAVPAGQRDGQRKEQ